MSCQPFYLKCIKIEHEYKEAQNIFHRKQGSSISTITTDNDSNKHEFFEETTINLTKGQANVLSEKMVLDREFAVSDALNLKAGIFTDVLNEIMIQTAPREQSMQEMTMKCSHHLCQFIQFFKQLFHGTLQMIP